MIARAWRRTIDAMSALVDRGAAARYAMVRVTPAGSSERRHAARLRWVAAGA